MKKRITAAFFAALLTLAPACAIRVYDGSVPPDVSVTASGTEVACVLLSADWDGERFSGGVYDSETGEDGPVFAALGGKIKVIFDGTAPDSVKIEDCVLNKSGTPKYTIGVDIDEYRLKNNVLTFDLAPNLTGALSSYSGNYLPGSALRGFTVRCEWNTGNRAEYFFAVRTDPPVIFDLGN